MKKRNVVIFSLLAILLLYSSCGCSRNNYKSEPYHPRGYSSDKYTDSYKTSSGIEVDSEALNHAYQEIGRFLEAVCPYQFGDNHELNKDSFACKTRSAFIDTTERIFFNTVEDIQAVRSGFGQPGEVPIGGKYRNCIIFKAKPENGPRREFQFCCEDKCRFEDAQEAAEALKTIADAY